MKNAINKNIRRQKLGLVFRPLTVLMVIGLVILTACKNDRHAGKALQTKDDQIHKIYERGPVRLELDVDHQEISIADRLHLSLTVIAAEAAQIEFPSIGEKFDQFGVVDYHTTLPELVDKTKKRICRTYILEPFLSGGYTIPPLKVRFQMQGEKGSQFHKIETEPIHVKVKSLLPEKKAGLKIHDIKPPVALPRSYKIWIGCGAILGVLLLASGVLLVMIRKRRLAARALALKRVPPHEIAFNELEALVNEHLIEKNEVKRFYHGISAIFRRYIENRYSLKAPELTTEEFLSSLKNNSHFTGSQNESLNEFLRYCDLVKFAEHQPEAGDIQKTFDTCRNFISETKTMQNDMEADHAF